jgi:preprotein translocase subunit SecG
MALLLVLTHSSSLIFLLLLATEQSNHLEKQVGSGIQVRILSSTGFARAAQNPYLFRITNK